MAKENPSWGYNRMVGAMAVRPDRRQYPRSSRHPSRPQTKAHDELERLIRTHLDVLAGTDFFTVDVVTLKGLITLLLSCFFIHLGVEGLPGRNDS